MEILKKTLLFAALAATIQAEAITYDYGDLDATAGTCTLTGWNIPHPSDGVLRLPETYVSGGVTYRVTAIAPHALDDLTNVTQVIIPSGVITIGNVRTDFNEGGTMFSMGSCLNFSNCPKLARFTVAEGNTSFSSSPAGMLKFHNGMVVAKVPQMVVTDNGRFDLDASVLSICEDAFVENASIKTLGLPRKLTSVSALQGYSRMKKLEGFSQAGSGAPSGYSIVDGILFNSAKTTLVSFPPAKQTMSYSIPAGVKTIGEEAFAFTMALYRVDLNTSQTEIKRHAFLHSGITEATVPLQVARMGEGVFRGCDRLHTLTVSGKMEIPGNFARDCKLLAKVNLPAGASRIWDCAFKNCPRLSSFPFSVDINMEYADSVFAGCAFQEVVFKESVLPSGGFNLGNGFFADNPQLELVDMGGVSVNPDGGMFFIGGMAFSGCGKLKSVIFSDKASFAKPAGVSPNFGMNSPVEKIILKSFMTVPGGHALYYDQGTHSPKVYMLTTGADMERWPLREFFTTTGDAVCTPEIYCEGYTMEGRIGSQREYVYPGATYYIPGGTFGQYRYALEESRGVKEMYGYRAENKDGRLNLVMQEFIPGLTFSKITVNGTIELPFPDDNHQIATDIPVGEVGEITVEYTVDGVDMKTIYPANPEWAGVDGVTADGEEETVAVLLDGKMLGFSDEVSYTVADISGRVVASGHATAVSLDGNPVGIYVVRAATPAGGAVVKKIILR